jgi:hypothetical protein
LGAHVLLMLGILSWVKIGVGWTRVAAALAITWALIIQVPGFFNPTPTFEVGPDWQEEVQRLKTDPHRLLRIWPDHCRMRL